MIKVWLNRIAAILMVSLMFFLVVKRYIFDDGKLNKNHRFSIATIYKISYPADGGPDAEFQFCVNQLIYKDYISFNLNERKIELGNKFLLKYYPPNPKIARILLDNPFDSSITAKLKIDTFK
ncbi:MAG: hypothetical protein MUF24_12855 [Chitinophagaceae bacterium]|nr:hypothetical protein [Chitinophagaceae bacterium]